MYKTEVAEKKLRINTLARAFALLEAPDRPADFKTPTLRRSAPVIADGLPEEYALLLKAYGPFTLGWPDNAPEAFELLSPQRSREVLPTLRQQLTERGNAAEVVPVSVYCNETWTYYQGDSLWTFAEKGSLEKHDDEATLEEHLIERVCVFAQWNLRTGAWRRD